MDSSPVGQSERVSGPTGDTFVSTQVDLVEAEPQSETDSLNEEREENEIEESDAEFDFNFADDEAAEATREDGLKAYNEGRYGDALDQQYRVVRYFANKYGSTSPKCGKYFLDYGLSQLRLLQAQDSIESALQPRDQESLETCFINLEVARVCLQKQLQEDESEVETELSIAEVHNALAQLNVEKEDFDGALREYEAELLIYRGLQETNEAAVPPRRIFSVLYGLADCYMKEGDFEGAEERLIATLEEIRKYPEGTIARELVEELEELLADARDMKGGKFQEIQEAIKKQFAPEAEDIPTAQEFYKVGNDTRHPFLSSVPGGGEGNEVSYLSMPMSATGHPLAANEHSNSQSVSLFPRQGSRSDVPLPSGQVQHVAVRKKAKNTLPGSAGVGEPNTKKARVE